MLTEAFPVEHKTKKNLGAGVCVGATTATSTNQAGQITTTVLFIVLWEGHKMPSPHSNAELEHLMNHENWFADYFNASIDDLDDDDDADIPNETLENNFADNEETTETVIVDAGLANASSDFTEEASL